MVGTVFRWKYPNLNHASLSKVLTWTEVSCITVQALPLGSLTSYRVVSTSSTRYRLVRIQRAEVTLSAITSCSRQL